jgi:hypothetical protein
MANNKIYVVIGRTNPADYTVQTYSWAVACFTDKAKAEQHVADCETESARISKERNALYGEYSAGVRGNSVIRINRPDGTYTFDYEKGKEFNDGLYEKYEAACAYLMGSAVFDRTGQYWFEPNTYHVEEVELIV